MRSIDLIDRYYEILEVKPGGSLEEVKRAYRDMVKVWHPDRFSRDPRLQEKAQEKLKEINEAYEKLRAFLSCHGTKATEPPFRPSQSHSRAESHKTQASDSESAQTTSGEYDKGYWAEYKEEWKTYGVAWLAAFVFFLWLSAVSLIVQENPLWQIVLGSAMAAGVIGLPIRPVIGVGLLGLVRLLIVFAWEIIKKLKKP